MKLLAAGATNVGMKRTHNEDCLIQVPEENLFVVADGMGGHACGEVASQIAVGTVAEFFKSTSDDQEITWPYKERRGLQFEENRLATGIKLANRQIFETAQTDARKRGMGTTIVAALFSSEGIYTGHCGDSRAYRFRDGQIEQITDDHSLLNDYLKNHTLTPDEIENFPHKNVIVRALGMKDQVEVDVNRMEPNPGDLYMLCTDGLSGMIKDEDMNTMVQGYLNDVEKANDVEGMCHALIDQANENGGTDNITVVCVKVLAD